MLIYVDKADHVNVIQEIFNKARKYFLYANKSRNCFHLNKLPFLAMWCSCKIFAEKTKELRPHIIWLNTSQYKIF